MNNFPPVAVQWHGYNQDNCYRIVATQMTVRLWLENMPLGQEFTIQEATKHIIEAVHDAILAKPYPEKLEEGIWQETGRATDEEALYGILDHNFKKRTDGYNPLHPYLERLTPYPQRMQDVRRARFRRI